MRHLAQPITTASSTMQLAELPSHDCAAFPGHHQLYAIVACLPATDARTSLHSVMSAFVPPVSPVVRATRGVQSLSSAAHAAQLSLPVAARAPSSSAAVQEQPVRGSSGEGPQAPGAKSSRVLLVMDGALRIDDNAALGAALQAARGAGGAIVPMARIDASGAAAPATELMVELRKRGSDLVAVRGDIVNQVVEALRRLRLGAVYVNRAPTRDIARLHRRLRTAASKARVEFLTFGACGLARDPDAVVKTLPEFVRGFNSKAVPEPLDAPERLPALPRQARALGVKDALAQMGGGTTAGIKVLQGIVEEKEMRRIRVRQETAFALLPLLNCGAVSEAMVAKMIVRKLGSLKGSTFEELLWRSFMCASYEKMHKVGATASSVAA